jgi:hypothetical protein
MLLIMLMITLFAIISQLLPDDYYVEFNSIQFNSMYEEEDIILSNVCPFDHFTYMHPIHVITPYFTPSIFSSF